MLIAQQNGTTGTTGRACEHETDSSKFDPNCSAEKRDHQGRLKSAELIFDVLKKHLVKLHHQLGAQVANYRKTVHSMHSRMRMLRDTCQIYNRSLSDLQSNSNNDQSLGDLTGVDADYDSNMHLLRIVGGLVRILLTKLLIGSLSLTKSASN